jgi:hypothetical protein
MMIWNPVPHIQHAWTGTKTVWGKIALVLFYSFIWLQIISGAWTIVWPRSQGLDCIIDLVHKNETAEVLVVALLRGLNVFAVGFFCYADVGGLKVKNVAMVAIFITLFVLTLLPLITMAQAGGCSSALAQMWVLPTWAITALVFTLLEEKLGDHGTAAETQNLVV